MNPNLIIRNETQADVSAITEVTIAAFKTLEISHHTEQYPDYKALFIRSINFAIYSGLTRVPGSV